MRAAGIDDDVLYFADSAHAPYGDRDDVELGALLAANLRWFERRDVDAVVMACNTSCAVAARSGGFPRTPFAVLDLIENAAAALTATSYGRIAVIATAATVRSGAYGIAIRRYAGQLRVDEIGAPALVPLVESGELTSARARAAVAAACARLAPDVEAIVYGCTHYPLLDTLFAAALDARIVRLDPAVAQARAARAFARGGGSGVTHFVTTGDPVGFERNVRRWTNVRAASFSAAATHGTQRTAEVI